MSGVTGKPSKHLNAEVHSMVSYWGRLYGISLHSNGGELGMSHLSQIEIKSGANT